MSRASVHRPATSPPVAGIRYPGRRCLGRVGVAIAVLVSAVPAVAADAGTGPIRVLFLGDAGHHRPAARFAQLEPALAGRGIELVYTDRLADITPATLAAHDVLAVYANHPELPPAAEAAILEHVRAGRGLVPIHCASACFRNSPAWVDLVGAEFQRHGAGEFRTVNVAAEHPVMRDFGGFQSWDETYVHSRHNDRGRTVLEVRLDGEHREPWTWVRAEGRGRVFYTAWGHDERTWGNPGFHNLLERGIRFAAGRDPAAAGPFVDRPALTTRPPGLPAFEYEPADVPRYVPGGGRQGDERVGTMQKPLEPEASRRHAITPEGFRVELYAAEPLLAGKPLALCFDAEGVVYVAESVDYPNDLVEPPAEDPAAAVGGRDRIVRLVDADGDGRADRREVFAENLSIPTSMLAHDGGLIVTMAPNTLLLEDTDGDGRADRRTVLFSGWGTGDTHAGPSNLTWGLDGWVYGIVGYAGFRGTVGGEPLSFPMGFFRFLPDGSRLEYLRSTNNNSWGFGFSEEGLVFGSTANGNPSEHMPLANRVYERVRGWSAERLGGIAGSPLMDLAATAEGGTVAIRQVDHHGRFTAAAGHRLYTARAYPREYWNRTAFVCEPTGHVVATFPLAARGAGFTSRMGWNLVASDDEWTAPIQAEVGPDGQVWVVDWYNFIVQHNPTPAGFETGRRGAYVTPLRDKTRGRIWRVVHDEPTPAGASASWQARGSLPAGDALVAVLRDDNMFWRERAQRKILARAAADEHRGRDLVPALVALVQDASVDEIGLNPAAIHAIWTLRLLGVLEGPAADPQAVAAVEGALVHPSVGVRMNAVKALPRTAATLGRFVACGLVDDPSPLVRLALLEALGEADPAPEAGGLVAALLADPRTLADPVLADAATSAAAVQAPHVLPALAGGGAAPESAAAPAIGEHGGERVVERVVERVAEHVARAADAAVTKAVLVRAAEGPPAIAAAAVTGFARGWPAGTPADFGPDVDAALVKLVDSLPAAAQGQVVTLAQRSGSRALDSRIARISDGLVALLDAPGADDAERVAAAERLVQLRPADAAVVDLVLERVGRAGPEVSAGLVAALGRSTAASAPAAVLDRLASFTPPVREAAVRTALANRDWAALLVDRLERRLLPLGDIPIADRAKLTDHPDRQVRDRARRAIAAGGGLPDADRQKVIEEFLPVVLRGGDVDRGRIVYRTNCGKCHVHAGAGPAGDGHSGDVGGVGPELTGMAVHPAHELLVHILDPNRSVEGNYRAYTVLTGDGRVVTGLLAAESRTAIEIVDAERRRVAIQRDEIDEFTASPNSLMPVGFEKQIPPEGMADLIAFLTARGAFLPVPLEKVATAVSTKGMFHSTEAMGERLVFSDWSPKQFGGVPFLLVDPQGQRVPNVILLHGPLGEVPPRMPREVRLPVNSAARAIHLLGGIAGWGFPAIGEPTVSLIVRLRYEDGTVEDHPLVNGRHVADYIRRVDVPESDFAFDLAGKQVRHVRITPRRQTPITAIDLVKGDDRTAPVVMALTVETL